MKPIKPRDIEDNKIKVDIPDNIIETVNDMLRNSYIDGRCVIYVDTLVDALCTQYRTSLKRKSSENKISLEREYRNNIFNNNWLDFEDIYKENGWNVRFIKLPYYESSSDYWIFEEK